MSRPSEDAQRAALQRLARAALLFSLTTLILLIVAVQFRLSVVLLDGRLHEGLQALRGPFADRLMLWITTLGGAPVTVPLVAGFALWLAVRRRYAELAVWLGATIGARVAVVAIKSALQRARPLDVFSGFETYAFPSGHSASALAVYGMLALLLAQRQPSARRMAIGLGATSIVLAVGLSRLYLGVHWFTDVLAGLSVAAVAVALAVLLLARAPPRQALPPGSARLAVLLVVVALLAYAGSGGYADAVARYLPSTETV